MLLACYEDTLCLCGIQVQGIGRGPRTNRVDINLEIKQVFIVVNRLVQNHVISIENDFEPLLRTTSKMEFMK